MKQNLIVIIMAGGLGKRMYSNLPKVLHKIKGKPMLVHVIDQSILLKPIKIMIVVGKYKDTIIDNLKNYIDLSNIDFVYQHEPLGTGHAVQCCLTELNQLQHNSITLILSGDVPLLQYDTLVEFLQHNNNARLISTALDNPSGYGRIIEENSIFIKIVEEKDCSHEEKIIKKINCGIYVFNTDLLCKYITQLDNNNSQSEFYLTDIIKIIKLHENIIIDTFEIPKDKQYQIMGVNTQEQLFELDKFIEN